MQSLFRRHGEFCASHPLEVVVATMTLIISLMSMGATVPLDRDQACGWNYECAKAQTLRKSDVIVLSFARCMALVYIYMQFRNLRRVGSKHLLGISGIFTIFSSFVFCIAFVKLFGNTITSLYEVLPFFLFLVDLTKASALAVFALSASNRAEIRTNIGQALELIGPALTLDAVVETLAIGLGTISGAQQLVTMCSFGCLSVVANYVAFMTFYPACLALVLELSLEMGPSRTGVSKYKHLVVELKQDHEANKPNPVLQRVKIIMSAGLAVVHLHSRLGTGRLVPGTSSLVDQHTETREPDLSVVQYYLYRLFAVHVDYGLTLLLGMVLLIKYVLVDRHTDEFEMKHTLKLRESLSRTQVATQTDEYTELEEDVRTSFSLGGDDSDYEEVGVERESRPVQTCAIPGLSPLRRLTSIQGPRPVQECSNILKTENGVSELTDEEIKLLVSTRHIQPYMLEKTLGDSERGVSIRRQIITDKIKQDEAMDKLPYSNYEYSYVNGACCENVVGYMPVPVGVAGPLLLDGHEYMVPMATTEGCLVASTNRGCRALSQSGGVQSVLLGDGMCRGPVVRFPSARKACELKLWLEKTDSFDRLSEVFSTTSRFAQLQHIQTAQAGRLLYIRFTASTGDAMGMNMLSKGVEKCLQSLQTDFPTMEIISLSGNFCTDKKPSAINWIEGRGKSVVCDAVIPGPVVQSMLKTTVKDLVELNINKNLIGSAMAGSIGGFNAHAANIVTAMFIATGQDPAQVVASSNCITLMEVTGEKSEDLYISCSMPSLEVGTVGGGTILPPQAACLKMLGVQGSCDSAPGNNAQQLARVVCATVLAGELSLMAALAAGHLVRSHLRHNRSSINMQGSFQSSSCLSKSIAADMQDLRSTLIQNSANIDCKQSPREQNQKMSNNSVLADTCKRGADNIRTCENGKISTNGGRHRISVDTDENGGKDFGACINNVS
ncbi:3-hydroxy-3-methylglutaryl-coenzyme A reductase-like isoform X2 [Mya arenaria]|nr:3-hydroxy-3-methylglutaryl-coenzyme A reductase-like isoform X2 [Mya arenaria]XP_052793014.1 3-hydroxy-3-methylglutaryl-coenzyme A reductase-like isoform X2 [Mya arenaria]XP_052793015.1 3-hydroxy-3-methylglutaryl-coenzyme A reductase-like isoform X2 [Mya arenaria]